jgi:serine/threonine-protein kinase
VTDAPCPDPTPGPERPDPVLGRTLADRYRIDALLARGGMARVYRARDLRLERDVAVKVLSQPYADDPAFTERFLGEARAAASLSHPSLVHVYDSGSDGAMHFIVMELLDRHHSLRGELDEHGRMDRDEVVRIGRELLAGLRVVHARGLVHCDVKAGNVMLGPGPAKLIDFGVARPPHQAVEGDTSIGSLQSMSPEQLRGDALTPASDLFSLGVVLYEALTGHVPFAGRTPQEVSAAHAAGAVRPPSSFTGDPPGRLDDAILQALRDDPASRFHSADAMARALTVADDDAAPAARADETQVIGVPQPRRSRAARDGYVPPPVPPPVPVYAAPPRASRPAPQRRSRAAALVGTLLVLGAAALVVAFVVIPLVNLGGFPGGPGGASPTSSASAAPGTVLVPQTVGLATRDAMNLATSAGLDWTVRCNQDPSQPEGIVDQEPPAGTSVASGGAFTMFSARVSDCR